MISARIQTNRETYVKELLSTGRRGLNELVEALGRGHYFDRARCNGHDRYDGGTVNHSLWVLKIARETAATNPEKYPEVDPVSLTLVCLLHDICDMPNGFREWTGHGRRSAKILDVLKVELSDEELGAIRFHNGHRIIDDFDKRIATYSKTTLARLLKHSDWVAAGVADKIPFGQERERAMIDLEGRSHQKVYFDHEAKRWYLDTKTCLHDSITISGRDIPIDTLKSDVADGIFGINLFHICSYDLMVMEHGRDGLGVFTVSSATMGDGDFYRSDRGEFGYRNVILYRNRFRDLNARHFLVTENRRGLWSVVSLRNGRDEFIERKLLVDGAASEHDALDMLRHIKHGIDITNDMYFERLDCKNASIEDWIE